MDNMGAFLSQKHYQRLPPTLLLLFLLSLIASQQTQATPATPTTANGTNQSTAVVTPMTTDTPPATTTTIINASSSNVSYGAAVPGCGPGLDPAFSYLCDRRAAWGIVLETLASLGFATSAGLLLGLVFRTLWVCASATRRRQRFGGGGGFGGTTASACLFLLATAGVFAVTFAFIVRLTPGETCPTRLFLFGVLFSLALGCLAARALALLGFAAARGWGEPALALGLFTVQVVIAVEWLLIVLVRDARPCAYSQGEFVMLLIYVLFLLALGALLSLRNLCRSCFTYSYSYTGDSHRPGQTQAALLCATLLLSASIWVVWIALLTRGNAAMGRRPVWDDPVLSVALVANGWVLLLGHGLAQVAFLCRGERSMAAGGLQEAPLSFAGWTSPNADMPLGLRGNNSTAGGRKKEGRENGSFENDAVGAGAATADPRRGRRAEPVLRSPYESGFSMTEIDPDKDYTIPRPQTTNITEPYDDYYGRPISD